MFRLVRAFTVAAVLNNSIYLISAKKASLTFFVHLRKLHVNLENSRGSIEEEVFHWNRRKPFDNKTWSHRWETRKKSIKFSTLEVKQQTNISGQWMMLGKNVETKIKSGSETPFLLVPSINAGRLTKLIAPDLDFCLDDDASDQQTTKSCRRSENY